MSRRVSRRVASPACIAGVRGSREELPGSLEQLVEDMGTGRAGVGLPLVLVFILSLPAVTQRLYAADEIEYFAYLRSLWFDQDLSFENESRCLVAERRAGVC